MGLTGEDGPWCGLVSGYASQRHVLLRLASGDAEPGRRLLGHDTGDEISASQTSL
jgi:hypothetical protein